MATACADESSGAFSAAHIGDLHFWRYPKNPLQLLNKRLLGIANLALNRAKRFPPHAPPILCARLAEMQPTWALFSGDFTTTALESEFDAAYETIAPAVDRFRSRVRAVPGNHDRYTNEAIEREEIKPSLLPWMSVSGYQVDKLPSAVALIGFDATTRNGLDSYGRVKPEDMRIFRLWAEQELGGIREAWVLCHFPAEVPGAEFVANRSPQLRDVDPLIELLGSLSIPVLYLHGHYHHRWIYRSRRAPNVVYLNAGAPTQRRKNGEPDLGFYRLAREDGQTRIELQTYAAAERSWSSAPVAIPSEPGASADLQP